MQRKRPQLTSRGFGWDPHANTNQKYSDTNEGNEMMLAYGRGESKWAVVDLAKAMFHEDLALTGINVDRLRLFYISED